MKKLRQLIESQGGDPDVTEDFSLFPEADVKMELRAGADGYVTSIDAMKIGLASQHTGAGREKKEDSVDLSAGIRFEKKVGDRVGKGDVICTLYGNNVKKVGKALEEADNAVRIGREKRKAGKLIKKVIKQRGQK